jgi:hypothetical protein
MMKQKNDEPLSSPIQLTNLIFLPPGTDVNRRFLFPDSSCEPNTENQKLEARSPKPQTILSCPHTPVLSDLPFFVRQEYKLIRNAMESQRLW